MIQPRGPDHLHPDVLELLNRLVALEQGRQSLLDHLWAEIPSIVNEYIYQPAQTANVPLLLSAVTSELWECTSAVAIIPAAATGLLQLGAISLPLSQGLTLISPLRVVMTSGALRSITSTVTGPTALLLCGTLHPTRGTMH